VVFRVVFRPAAVSDLDQIYDFIAEDSPQRAIAFVRRIHQHCQTLSEMPERAPRRNDLGEGVRLLVFEKRIAIAYRIHDETVEILRIFYAGRDYQAVEID